MITITQKIRRADCPWCVLIDTKAICVDGLAFISTIEKRRTDLVNPGFTEWLEKEAEDVRRIGEINAERMAENARLKYSEGGP